MKISKRQLRRIIKEEKRRLLSEMPAVAQADAVYDDANTAAIEIVEDMMNNYGAGPEVVKAVVQALRDAADMAENDDRLMGY